MRTLEEHWGVVEREVMSVIGKPSERDVKRGFYAGASAVLTILLELQKSEASPQEFGDTLSGLCREVLELVDDL